MASDTRPVVFEAILRQLLDSSPVAANRKQLARAVEVNEATISHYLHGRIRPSFENLVRIADFFNVSMDYLVFGERPQLQTEDEPAGLRAQIRRAMAEASDLNGRHLDLVTRIGRRLHARIEEAARAIVAEDEGIYPVGFLTCAEAIGMESCITQMRIMTRLFQSDTTAGSPGTFLEVVVANLRKRRRYQYLLYGDLDYWRPQVKTFRTLVTANGVPAELAQQYLQFRCLNEELANSVCILDLDLSLIERWEPFLWERHQQFVRNGTWAYLSIERDDAQGGVPVEPVYLESVLRQFQRDWDAAKAI